MKKGKISMLLIVVTIGLSAFKFNCSIGGKEYDNVKFEEKDEKLISNGIQIKETGDIKVERAYLMLDNGEPVSDSNIVALPFKVKLVVVTKNEWVQENGKSFIGASEKMVASTGEILIDEADLFKDHTAGIKPLDARAVSMWAELSLKKKLPQLTRFTISFRIWDKKGNSAIEGSYDLFAQ